jgi:short-subunit dehydrogenase
MNKRIKEKYGPWAIVTGGTEGIGKEFVRELLQTGISVLVVSRKPEKFEKLRTELNQGQKPLSETTELRYLSLDLGEPGSVQKLEKETKDLDIGLLVHSSGYGSIGTFETRSLENELSMVDLNARSTVEIVHRYIKKLRPRKHSGIILFGSLVGFQGAPNSATYSATKNFVQAFAEALYWEEKPNKIDILSVAPGPVETGFGKRAGMQMGMAQSPEKIPRQALSKLGKTSTLRPEFLSKFLGYSMATLPRPLRVILLGIIMKGMIK